MKILAFIMSLAITVVGALGVVAPSGVVWIARHAGTSGAFYVVAVVRVVFGLALISAAPASRAPKTLRILGSVVLIAGIATAMTGLAAMERARVIIEWWVQQGSGVVRLTSLGLVALGGVVAFACAPAPKSYERPRD